MNMNIKMKTKIKLNQSRSGDLSPDLPDMHGTFWPQIGVSLIYVSMIPYSGDNISGVLNLFTIINSFAKNNIKIGG